MCVWSLDCELLECEMELQQRLSLSLIYYYLFVCALVKLDGYQLSDDLKRE